MTVDRLAFAQEGDTEEYTVSERGRMGAGNR